MTDHTEVLDNLEENADEETKILQRKLKDQQDAEKAAARKNRGQTSRRRRPLAAAVMGRRWRGFDLQADALGTIKDILSRLKNLPPEERIRRAV